MYSPMLEKFVSAVNILLWVGIDVAGGGLDLKTESRRKNINNDPLHTQYEQYWLSRLELISGLIKIKNILNLWYHDDAEVLSLYYFRAILAWCRTWSIQKFDWHFERYNTAQYWQSLDIKDLKFMILSIQLSTYLVGQKLLQK